MAVSDEDVQAKQEKLVKMRAELADAEAKRVANEASLTNEIVMADLNTEEARLAAAIAEAKASATKTAVREAATPLAAARDAQAAAREQAKAAEKAAANTDTGKGE